MRPGSGKVLQAQNEGSRITREIKNNRTKNTYNHSVEKFCDKMM